MKQLTGSLDDHYRQIEPLHEGVSVVTYAAVDSASDEAVVIKMLDFKKIQAWKALELFERETTVLQRLSHPAIPEYLDAFQAEYAGVLYSCLVQKRVTGKTLQQWIDSGYRFAESEMRELATQLLQVLHYLHGFHPPIIHRDIKPDNLIWHENTLSVLDFGGVLKHLGPAQSTVVGTYGYMAPEQFQGKARLESDLYSVGMTLAHALSHVHPSHMQSRGLAIEIGTHLQCSATLLQWLKKMTALEPEARFQNAQQALAALDYLDGDKLQALKSAHDKDVFQPTAAALSSLSPLPAPRAIQPPSPAQLQGVELTRTPAETTLSIHRKNGVSTKMALKIDMFVTFPALVVLGILKWVGYSWLQAALIPSILFVPVAAFFLLMLHFAQLTLSVTPEGILARKYLGALTLQRRQIALKGTRFTTQVLGEALQSDAQVSSHEHPSGDSERAASLQWVNEYQKDQNQVLHLGLPLITYRYLADQLNAEIQKFEADLPALDTASDSADP